MTAFFFAPESPRMLALVRIALGLVLLYDALLHWRYAIELYSTSGPAMPIFPSPIFTGQVVPTPAVAVLAHTLLIFAVASAALGWHTRTSLAAAFVLSLWLGPLDLPGTFAKHSVIALHLLLLLAFSRCGEVWSLDHLTDANRAARCRLACAAPRKLMQILISCIYLGAAITKIKTPAFANGDLLTFSLLDDHWGSGRFGLWLSTLPHVPLLLSQATLLFEILFPALIWVGRCRRAMLCLAACVHLAMAGLLHLGTFSPIMLAALLSFVEERDLAMLSRSIASISRWQKMGSWSNHGREGTRIPASALPSSELGSAGAALRGAARHLLAATLFVACGFAVQWSYDWYGVFGRRSLEPLKEVSSNDFAEMLAQRPPAYEDYFHRIEVGNRFAGNQIFGSPSRFKVGQGAYVLAQLIQPHPAIELEGLLIAPGGDEVARFTHLVEPGINYAINGFELSSKLPPGLYRVVVQAEGFAIAERRFELEP